MDIHQKYLQKMVLLLIIFLFGACLLFIKGARHAPHNPLVRNPFEYLQFKKTIPTLHQPHKAIILSGSNSFYGFRADLFEQYTGIPTVNMAIQGSLGLNFMLFYVKPFLKKGDILILPLEYAVLLSNDRNNYISAHVSYADGFAYFKSLPLTEKLDYLRMLKKEYFWDSLKSSFKKNSAYSSAPIKQCVDSQGDMRCNHSSDAIRRSLHQVLLKQPPQDYLFINSQQPHSLPDYASLKILADFLAWARNNEITVIGTYPNAAQILVKEKTLVSRIKDWYETHQQLFIGDIAESFFPENKMYDTVYHLNASGAKQRTEYFAHRFCDETPYCKKSMSKDALARV